MPPMQSGGMPKQSAEAKAAFQSVLPVDDAVTMRPMFGNLAAFVNGNMFTGLFGEDLFVRVAGDERDQLLAQGGADFAPMAGRPMKGYVVLPAGWSERPQETRAWIDRSLESVKGLPPKEKKRRPA